MTVYLTSDLHFGHKLVSGLRGFDDPADHDLAVWASLVGELNRNDDLWVLGDISSGSSTSEAWALEQLATVKRDTGCRLHLITGNHDSVSPIHRDAHKRQRSFLGVFDSVQAFARRRGPDRVPVLLSHFPYSADHTEDERYGYARLRDEGHWLLHGHTHSTQVRTGPREIHVGWDAWRGPVSWDKIERLIQ